MHVRDASNLRRHAVLVSCAMLLVAPAVAMSVERADTRAASPPLPSADGHAEELALPLVLEPNLGQAPADARFVGRAGAYAVSLGATGIGFGLLDAGVGFSMRFVGADPDARLVAEAPLPGRSHYLQGADADAWITDVPHHERVRYEAAWPGIDVVVRGGPGGALEYDFIVAPGTDPAAARLAFDGVDRVRLTDAGALSLLVGGREILHREPVLYQEIAGERRGVEGGYRPLSDRTIAFWVGPYDARHALVIDPVIEYSTYVGGSSTDLSRAIAVDAAGSAYVTGQTQSNPYPTTAGALDTTYNTNIDAFVTKLNATGTGLVYSTYLGGTSEDGGYGIDVDAAGSAYVTGVTFSSAFPTTVGAHDTTLSGSQDAFVTKLNVTGSGLVFSTYLGGTDEDAGRGIAVDTGGSAYVVGRSKSSNFPTTSANRLDSNNDGGFDMFLARLNATGGGGVLYGTTIGGSSDDEALAVALEPNAANGVAYLTGWAAGSVDEIKAGAFDTSHNGGRDVLVSKINTAAANATLANVYTTFVGGSSADEGRGIAADAGGNAYVAGVTQSTNFPVVAGSNDTSSNGNGDAFVTKINPTGTAPLVYSTYLGGSSTDEAFAIAVDDDREAHVTGRTTSTNFPTVSPIQTRQNDDDAFVTTLSASGATLLFSTYLGGDEDERGLGIAVDALDDLYVTGHTTSDDFPTTPGAFDRTHNGNDDVFVTKLFSRADLGITKTDSPDPVEEGDTLTYFVNVTNAGPSAATNVTVNDTLPASATFGTATPSQGTCGHAGGVVTCDLGTLAANATAIIAITVTPNEPGVIVNEANVTSSVVDPNSANNTAMESTLVTPQPADLSITKEDEPDPIQEKETLTYYLNVTNDGPGDAHNVTVTDTLPANVTFLDATSSQGSCGEAGGVVTCDVGTMDATDEVSIVVTVRPDQPGVIVDVANVTADEPDPVPADNVAMESTTVTPRPADIQVMKTDDADPVGIGQNVTYTIVVQNAGPGNATNVTLVDTVMPMASVVHINTSQGTCATVPAVLASRVECDLGTLLANSSAIVQIVVQASTPGTYTDTANAGASETDPDPTNNVDVETTLVLAPPAPEANLTLTKEDDTDPVFIGDRFNYTLNVTNEGPDDSENVTVLDNVPASMDIVETDASQGPGCTVDDHLVTCPLGTLEVGENATIVIGLIPREAGNFTNSATVMGDTSDPEPENNFANETTFVLPHADLSLDKADDADPIPVGTRFNYTLTVQNAGPSEAANVTVEDEVPPSFTIEETNTSQGAGCVVTGNVVTCDLGTLGANASATATIGVVPTEAGTFTDHANVTSDTTDRDPANDAANETTTVTPPSGAPLPPADLTCSARVEGNFLDWSPSAGATSYNVYRAVGSGTLQFLASTSDTEHLDTDVDGGTVYRYAVSAENATGESALSAECEITAIPFFGAWGLAALAVVGMVGAYALLRRRRRGL